MHSQGTNKIDCDYCIFIIVFSFYNNNYKILLQSHEKYIHDYHQLTSLSLKQIDHDLVTANQMFCFRRSHLCFQFAYCVSDVHVPSYIKFRVHATSSICDRLHVSLVTFVTQDIASTHSIWTKCV